MLSTAVAQIFAAFAAQRLVRRCEPAVAAAYDHYRCRRQIRALLAWLRSRGVVSRTPLHTLRKEYGSQINSRFGLTAAQEMLRHANIHTTAAH